MRWPATVFIGITKLCEVLSSCNKLAYSFIFKIGKGNDRSRGRFMLSILPHVGAESFVRARPKFLSAAHPQRVGSNPNAMPISCDQCSRRVSAVTQKNEENIYAAAAIEATFSATSPVETTCLPMPSSFGSNPSARPTSCGKCSTGMPRSRSTNF